MPDRTSIKTPRRERRFRGSHSRRKEMMPAETKRITTVRINVARFELISETPTLPKMAVSAAKAAEPRANHCQPYCTGASIGFPFLIMRTYRHSTRTKRSFHVDPNHAAVACRRVLPGAGL